MLSRIISSGCRIRGRMHFSTSRFLLGQGFGNGKFHAINSEALKVPIAAVTAPLLQANNQVETTSNTQPLQSRTVAVISGGSGELGRRQVLNALREGSRYTNVIAVTSSPDQLIKYLVENGIPENDPRLLIADRGNDTLENAISKVMPHGVDNVEIYNTIGGSNKELGPKFTAEQLEEKNSVPTMEFLKAVGNASIKSGVKSIGVVHYSSITVSMNDLTKCQYANERKKTEDLIFDYFNTLQAEQGIKTKAVAMRVGFIWQDLQIIVTINEKGEEIKQYYFDTGYAYGPHHHSHFPVIFCMGSGSQTMQPIHIMDLVEGGENALSHPLTTENLVVDAVTKVNEMSYSTFMSLLNPKKELLTLHIPFPIAKAITEFATYGHNQDYAANYAEEQERRREAGESDALCPERFDMILGKEARKITAEFYIDGKAVKYSCAKLDLSNVIWRSAKSGIKNPRHLYNLARETWAHKDKVKIGSIEKE